MSLKDIKQKIILNPVERVIVVADRNGFYSAAVLAAAEYAALVQRAETAEAELQSWQNRTPVVCLNHPCYKIDVYITTDVEHSRSQGYITVLELCEKYTSTEAELARVRAALEKIRSTHGKVCENYETCSHISCESSYAAWAIADETLQHLAPAALPAEQEPSAE